MEFTIPKNLDYSAVADIFEEEGFIDSDTGYDQIIDLVFRCHAAPTEGYERFIYWRQFYISVHLGKGKVYADKEIETDDLFFENPHPLDWKEYLAALKSAVVDVKKLPFKGKRET